MIQPSHLKQGDTIGIVCPSGYIPLEKVQICIQTLEKWGYKVKLGTTVGAKKDSFSGTDQQRAEDLQTMLDDASVKAILCARGGYGASRIINTIHFQAFNKQPKWVIGFSDITVLHAAILQQNCMSIHGPMAAAFAKGEAGEPYIQSLKKALEGEKTSYTIPAHSMNTLGNAKAELVGGNLCILAHLIGSKNALDTNGKILFLEDVGEYHYNIDRLMIQCKNAGLFDNLAGLVIGGFTDLKDPSSDFGASANEIIKEHTLGYSYPICFDFPISHSLPNFAIKQGQVYSLAVFAQEVSLTEA
ncbi:MAG: LD-carboxypeptidase [Chitinophagaceae bacterium]|jgi:muramoyltetrapeptide carboxypeptidase|nr:LD-carboxypeptidase [Chitinophagaceae bacterium]